MCDKGATHQEISGKGARIIMQTTYSGSTEIEKDISCCTKCNENNNCEYWVREIDSNICLLKSNDGAQIEEVSSSHRRGGLRSPGKNIGIYYHSLVTIY